MQQLSEIHFLLSEYNNQKDVKFQFPDFLPDDFQLFLGTLTETLGCLNERLSIQNHKKEQLLQKQKCLKSKKEKYQLSALNQTPETVKDFYKELRPKQQHLKPSSNAIKIRKIIDQLEAVNFKLEKIQKKHEEISVCESELLNEFIFAERKYKQLNQHTSDLKNEDNMFRIRNECDSQIKINQKIKEKIMLFFVLGSPTQGEFIESLESDEIRKNFERLILEEIEYRNTLIKNQKLINVLEQKLNLM